MTRLTGITQGEVEAAGKPLRQALEEFVAWIGTRAVYFHNSPFDEGFLRHALDKHGLSFENTIHDTLQMARDAWPMASHYRYYGLRRQVHQCRGQ
jgi:DNA polymerase III subunit epsilon